MADILIDPVSRIEGHAKITVHLDESGEVADAKLHVTEFRGFERMFQGRPLWEMPAITARICGICPVSHLLTSAKAGDRILSVDVPPVAEKLRRLMNLAQIIQSHALSFFHLSSPDLLLGMDSDPEQRNIFALSRQEPELARGGIRLRRYGQRIIEALGGQRIHPAWAIPGGVRTSLNDVERSWIRGRVRTDHHALVALDADARIPHGNFVGDAPLFPLRCAEWPSAIDRKGGDWQEVSFTCHHDGRYTLHKLRSRCGNERRLMEL